MQRIIIWRMRCINAILLINYWLPQLRDHEKNCQKLSNRQVAESGIETRNRNSWFVAQLSRKQMPATQSESAVICPVANWVICGV